MIPHVNQEIFWYNQTISQQKGMPNENDYDNDKPKDNLNIQLNINLSRKILVIIYIIPLLFIS